MYGNGKMRPVEMIPGIGGGGTVFKILDTLEAKIKRIVVLGQPGQKVSEIPFQPTIQAWWYMPTVPTTQEV
jgi:hypothetical protein